MRYSVILCGILSAFIIKGHAQTSNDLRNKLLYNHESNFGASWTTNGLNIFARYGKIKDMHHTMFFEGSLQSLKHPKEYKTHPANQYSSAPTPRPYVFGKENSLICLTAAWGMRELIAEKAEKNGVELSFIYSGGFTLGILKPYYLDLLYSDNNNPSVVFIKSEGYSQANQQSFLDPNYIYGYSGFSKGWNGLTVLPAIHIKAGLNVDWAHFDDRIATLEIGGQVEAFPKKVPVMIIDNNRWLWPSVYASLTYGKRW